MSRSKPTVLTGQQVFDETDGTWHTHLNGARYMLRKLAASHEARVESNFLLTWFLYHEVLACFTHPHREKRHELDLVQLLDGLDLDKTMVSPLRELVLV